MKRLGKFVVLLISVALIAPTLAHSANTPDEQWIPTIAAGEVGPNFQGLLIQENTRIADRISLLWCGGGNGNDATQVRFCSSLNDENIGPKINSAGFDAIFPRCIDDKDKNCITGISAISPDGKVINGSYIRNFPESSNSGFSASPERNFPAGKTPSLWRIPGVQNGSGSEEYLVRFTLRGTIMSSLDKLCPECTNFKGYSAIISPVSIKKGQFRATQSVDARGISPEDCAKDPNICQPGWRNLSQEETQYCAGVQDGACALKEAFPVGYRFKLDVRLGASPTGWIHGRIKDPKVNLVKMNDYTQLSVEGEPVVVPVMGLVKTTKSLPLRARSFYENNALQSGYGIDGKAVQMSTPDPDGEGAFYEYGLWKDLIGDKASASPMLWTYRSLTIPFTSAECFKDTSKFVGVVTTNAMMYAGGPPVFNKADGTLEYKVGSPHLTSKGEVFKGTYNLQLSSETARCIYKFTNAPIQASISIVNESGEKSVATTTVNEKDGWLRMAAYGFTFSNPTVKVKLSQDNKAVTPTSGLKTSITCVKGKTTKKVTAINPKCPTGYKKK